MTDVAHDYNDDFYFRHVLYERCPVRIVIENDAKCAAMAEAGKGALKDVSDGLVLIFGTMIGGGIIHDHKLLSGKEKTRLKLFTPVPFLLFQEN
jgi:predicted NBD/HSP70 family sugar kinase